MLVSLHLWEGWCNSGSVYIRKGQMYIWSNLFGYNTIVRHNEEGNDFLFSFFHYTHPIFQFMVCSLRLYFCNQKMSLDWPWKVIKQMVHMFKIWFVKKFKTIAVQWRCELPTTHFPLKQAYGHVPLASYALLTHSGLTGDHWQGLVSPNAIPCLFDTVIYCIHTVQEHNVKT